MVSEGSVRAHIAISPDLIEEVDRLVGPRRRSQFFVDAVKEKIRRERLLAAANRAAGTLADVDVPGWGTSEEAREWVVRLREEDRLPPRS